MQTTLTVGGALLCIGAIIAIRILAGAKLGKLTVPDLPKVQVGLAIAASWGLMGTRVGQWIHRAVTWADAGLNGFIGSWTGASVTGLLAVVVVALAVRRFLKSSADGQTLGLAAAFPVVGAMVPGAAGSVFVGIASFIAGVIGTVINFIF